VNIPVIAVGKISLQLAEEILTQGRADLIAMGRSFLVDPEFPNKAKEGRFEDIRPCLQCRLCSDAASAERKGLRCQVNAMVGREREWALVSAVQRRRILVVGGGPAGMEAARVAAWRGHEVLLYEQGPKLGGQMILAAIPPCKTPIQDFIRYLETQVRKLGVKIVLETNVTPSLVEKLKPDIVILATGTTSLIPRIPGVDMKHVRTAEEVLQGAPVGEKVVIIGGGLVGCELADELSERGKNVTIVEVLPEIPKGKGIQVMTRLLRRLEKKKVVILTHTQCLEITETAVICMDQNGRKRNRPVDSVVLATGAKPNRDLYVSISNLIPKTYLVGDCVEPGRIMEAVSDGFQIARDL
jgi:NADPH-dependent 2,4-dienoyl-CoA reductase/sulfur reductase-like enzyme